MQLLPLASIQLQVPGSPDSSSPKEDRTCPILPYLSCTGARPAADAGQAVETRGRPDASSGTSWDGAEPISMSPALECCSYHTGAAEHVWHARMQHQAPGQSMWSRRFTWEVCCGQDGEVGHGKQGVGQVSYEDSCDISSCPKTCAKVLQWCASSTHRAIATHLLHSDSTPNPDPFTEPRYVLSSATNKVEATAVLAVIMHQAIA